LAKVSSVAAEAYEKPAGRIASHLVRLVDRENELDSMILTNRTEVRFVEFFGQFMLCLIRKPNIRGRQNRSCANLECH
jgi:hypothetical protein